MFSRWGAFVYRHRRIVLVLAIVVGVDRRVRGRPRGVGPVRGRLARPGLRVRRASPTGSPTSSAPVAGR